MVLGETEDGDVAAASLSQLPVEAEISQVLLPQHDLTALLQLAHCQASLPTVALGLQVSS